MNHLTSDQIQFHKMWVDPCPSPFKCSFISRRLKALIEKKLTDQKWEVVQVPIKSVFDYYEFESVFTSPSMGTVLFCKKKNSIKLRFVEGYWATSKDFS